MRTQSDIKICIYFLGSSKEKPWRLSTTDSEIFVLCPRFCAVSCQQQSSPSSVKTARQYYVSVQVQDCGKSTRPNVDTSTSPCRPHSAVTSLQIFHHHLLPRSAQSASIVLVASVPLLVSQGNDGIPQRLVFYGSLLVPWLKQRVYELQNLSTRQLGRTIGVVQRLTNSSWSVIGRFRPCQTFVPPRSELSAARLVEHGAFSSW